MGYYIDLSKISLEQFREKLANGELLPSQQILKDDLDERFQKIKDQKINNMNELKQALKTKAQLNKFAATTFLPIDYLTILRREVNSYHPQARKIKDFPCLSAKTIKGLAAIGIKTTVELYEQIVTKAARKKLQEKLGITSKEALLLAKLTDVSRVRYINQAFATLLINSEYDTLQKINQADFEELYQQLSTINQEKGYFRGKIFLKDMKYLIKDTENVSFEIEY